MKNLKIAFLAIVAVATFSCSSDDDNNNNNGGSDDTYIDFKVNGEQFNIMEPTTMTTAGTVVFASTAEGQYAMLRMPNDATVGTHPLSEDNSADVTIYSASISIDGENVIDANDGSVTISSIGDEYMEGTFSFTGDLDGTPYTVTDGKFRAYKPGNN